MQLSQQDLPLPGKLENAVMGDIPLKYFEMKDYGLPMGSFCIDAEFKDFKQAFHIIKTVDEKQKATYKRKINDLFARDAEREKALVTLSVRSAWDLYFQIKKFPRDSEVLMTGITIPDMVRIVKDHGLVPVPVDLSPDTMQPDLEQIKAATSEKTVAMIFAFVFGVTYDPAPYAEFLRSRNIDIIEDCAQSFKSLDVYNGTPLATMTLFSFGTIKCNTAFYGAVAVIRESANLSNMPQAANLYGQMDALQETYKQYEVKDYKKKCLIGFGAWTALNSEKAFRTLQRYFKYRGQDMENEIISKLRGFAQVSDFLGKFRLKPCAPLLAMIHYRTANYTKADFAKRLVNYNQITNALTKNGYLVPGWTNKERSYWLYALPVPNQLQFRDFCNTNGVFCGRKSTQIYQVPVPAEALERNSNYRGAPNCGWLMENSVYLSVHNHIAPKTMDLIVKRMIGILDRYYKYTNQLDEQIKSKHQVQPLNLIRPKL